MRRIRRALRPVSTFLTHLGGTLLKAVVTSVIVGAIVVSVMHYMGVPVPHAADLLRGVSRLANILS